MENNNYDITVNLADALTFVQSKEFNDFLLNHTTISIGLFISEVLGQTIHYMMTDVLEEENS